jgi:hypothetical protein
VGIEDVDTTFLETGGAEEQRSRENASALLLCSYAPLCSAVK